MTVDVMKSLDLVNNGGGPDEKLKEVRNGKYLWKVAKNLILTQNR